MKLVSATFAKSPAKISRQLFINNDIIVTKIKNGMAILSVFCQNSFNFIFSKKEHILFRLYTLINSHSKEKSSHRQ